MINCQHWTPFKNHGKCGLNMYGGRPSIGTCELCVARGENNQAFANALLERYKTSHPAGAPKIKGCCDRADQA